MKRTLDRERLENERLTSDASGERLRSRQLEREVDRLKQNLEDYRYAIVQCQGVYWLWPRRYWPCHSLPFFSLSLPPSSPRRQVELQKDSTTTHRVIETDFRDRLRKKDLEIAEQLDKMEVDCAMHTVALCT